MASINAIFAPRIATVPAGWPRSARGTSIRLWRPSISPETEFRVASSSDSYLLRHVKRLETKTLLRKRAGVARAPGGEQPRDAVVDGRKSGEGCVGLGLVPIGNGEEIVGAVIGVAVRIDWGVPFVSTDAAHSKLAEE